MTEKECMEQIADILEMEVEDISGDMKLDEIDTWDSIAILSVISVMNEKYNKYPSAKEIRVNETINDLIHFLKGE